MCRYLSKARSTVSPAVIGSVAPSIKEDKLPTAGRSLLIKAAGIPTRLEIRSNKFMQNIRRFDVFKVICFVARKDAIRRAFVIVEMIEYAAKIVAA